MDRYTVTARLFPMVIFYFPVLIVGILYSFQFDEYSHLLTSLGAVGALSYFTAQIGRKGGKQKQRVLWESWGGAPSTQLLRWRDHTIDPHTKKRYHMKLQSLIPIQPFPSEAYEISNPDSADQIYAAWVHYLKVHTRDVQKYPLLYKENINYGFWRNLWALKPYAISLLLLLMFCTYGYYVLVLMNINPINFPKMFYITEAILAVIVLVWIFVVKVAAVKVPAFEYARRLLETTEYFGTNG